MSLIWDDNPSDLSLSVSFFLSKVRRGGTQDSLRLMCVYTCTVAKEVLFSPWLEAKPGYLLEKFYIRSVNFNKLGRRSLREI